MVSRGYYEPWKPVREARVPRYSPDALRDLLSATIEQLVAISPIPVDERTLMIVGELERLKSDIR